jgi:hypothetical protein
MADKKIQSTSKLLKAYNEIDAALKKATQAAGVRACVRVGWMHQRRNSLYG